MRPTRMRNLQEAHQAAQSRQVCSPLSKELRAKYGLRSVRVVEGDTVRVSRGAHRNVDAKVSGVDVRSGTVTLEGEKGEKQRGDRFDIKIHASNVRVTGINGGDKKRMKRITGIEKALPKPEPARPRTEQRVVERDPERHAKWPEADSVDLDKDDIDKDEPTGANANTTEKEGDLAKDDLAKDDLAKDDLAKDDLAKDDLAKDDLAKDDLAKDDLAKDDLAKDDLAKDDLAKDDLAKDDLAKDDLAKDDLAKDGQEKSQRAESGEAQEK